VDWEAGQPLRVDGVSRLEEVGELFHLAIEHDEVDSVSGLVLTLLGSPAQVGDQVEYRELLFEVTAAEGHGVKECLVSRVQIS
jgi:CBS domain containing-hemolysin-like protein